MWFCMSARGSRIVIWAGVGALFIGAFSVGFTGAWGVPRVDVSVSIEGRGGHEPATEEVGGEEVVVIYVGSSTCPYANSDWLVASVGNAMRTLSARANQEGVVFRAIGVALDRSPEEGLEHLRRIGRFDEVSAGMGWGNHLASEYIWEEVPGLPATPQILVLEREWDTPEESGRRSGYYVSHRRLLAREIGVEIRRWVKQGAPMASLTVGEEKR